MRHLVALGLLALLAMPVQSSAVTAASGHDTPEDLHPSTSADASTAAAVPAAPADPAAPRVPAVPAAPAASAVSAAPAAAAAPAANPTYGPHEPRISAIVTVDGPSVYRQVAEREASTRSADAVASWAASEAGALAAAEAAVASRQAPVADAAERLGADVVSRYTTAANGLLVHATPGQLEALAKVPGVLRVEPAPILRPDLGYSGPHVGSTRVAEELGLDGEGTVVAIIDTGIDYTHAHLGGPGTEEVWGAASVEGATETITDTWEGELLFPNDKVIGGWDFAGRHYDPPHICTPEREAAGDCTSTPHPDPDPLDGGSHGTHVGGIVAGSATAGLSNGVAPGAQLVGLKVYGNRGADEAADMVIDAIEWCTRVNLGLEDRGILPPRVDAINISLGESYAQGSRLYDEAVEAAVGSGIIVVASAGNSGDRAFIVGTPSASPLVLSVANSLPPSPGLQIEVRWDDEIEVHFGLESTIARPLSEAGRIESELAWFGRGCSGDEVHQDPTGKIALVARGECVFSEKLLNAQAAGAVAVLMFTDNRPKSAMAGNGAGIEIPAAMIDRQPGEDLAALIADGKTVTAVLDPELFGIDTSMADAIAGSSSRGPSKNGALKPDITAPGTGILSALRGTGTSGAAWSGTSMSGPHVAGGAALMHNRNRAEGLELGAADLAALLMNYARPAVFSGAGDDKTLVPVARQGAGEMDLWRAANGKLLVRAGDIASLYVGATSLTRPERHVRELTVLNLSDKLILFTVAADQLYEDDEGRGLEVIVPMMPAPVPPGSTVQLDVIFKLDPNLLREWELRPSAGASVGALTSHELDGFITITPITYGADSSPDLPAASIPYYVLPRTASLAHTRGLPAVGDEGDDHLTFTNRSAFDGDVELFVAPIDTAAGTDTEDPDEENVLRELDLRRVGVRFEPPTEIVTRTMLTFALARHEPAPVPHPTRYEIFLDVDRDGTTDFRVRDGSSRGRMRTYWAEWDSESGTVSGSEFVTDTLHSTDLYTYLSMLSVPIERVGMTEPEPFDFYVVHRGLNEDWLHTPSIDVAPDGALEDDGPRYSFSPHGLARIPDGWSIVVPARGTLHLGLAAEGERENTLLALYPDNRFENDEGQLQVLRPGDIEPRVWPVFLPQLMQSLLGN
jgi:subtilisin family serine protease